MVEVDSQTKDCTVAMKFVNHAFFYSGSLPNLGLHTHGTNGLKALQMRAVGLTCSLWLWLVKVAVLSGVSSLKSSYTVNQIRKWEQPLSLGTVSCSWKRPSATVWSSKHAQYSLLGSRHYVGPTVNPELGYCSTQALGDRCLTCGLVEAGFALISRFLQTT